jgi:hypothetical protein
MTITSHPLHRSGRALLTHPAPALGNDAKASRRIRVMQSWSWQPAVQQTVHLLPRHARPLAAAPKRAIPVTPNMETKRTQRRQVGRHTVITIVTLDHRPQPLANFGYALMHSFTQLRFDSLQLSAFPLTHRAPQDREHPVAVLLPTNVREAQKVECLRLPLSTPFSSFGCVAAKLEYARFLRMQFQPELGEPFRQLLMEPCGVRLVLKTHHEVISPPHDNHVARGFCLAPVLHPEVEHIVQVDVGQQRRGTAALWGSFFAAPPLSFFQHACVQPFSDEPHYALVCYPVLDELNQPLMVQSIEKRTDVAIQHPVHFLLKTERQGVQRIVLALAWEDQMVFLGAKGYRCIAHDRRAHGRSSQPWDGNEMDTYADDLAALVEALDLKDAIHVGHSTGGGEVARYIGRHGTDRVSMAVLISAVTPLMLKTSANPGGLPIEVFDEIRAGVLADRSQFFKI